MKIFSTVFIAVISISYINAGLADHKETRTHEKIPKSGVIAKRLALFGNGKVFLGYHHTLIIINYGDEYKYDGVNQYRLLEVVEGSNGYIWIKDEGGKTEFEALSKRIHKDVPVQRWGKDAQVNCYNSQIQSIIDDYNKSKYSKLYKNCRHFVNTIFWECGSSKRVTD